MWRCLVQDSNPTLELFPKVPFLLTPLGSASCDVAQQQAYRKPVNAGFGADALDCPVECCQVRIRIQVASIQLEFHARIKGRTA